jgi:2-C-methyl-D-erythritol 2,4-cyclodiphosphate synthase
MMRIGSGFDVHAFTEGSAVTLGGIQIAHTQSLLAHSDGDVLIHALCDALLGALALGDIGVHFPPSDASYKNADSTELLAQCMRMVRSKGYQLANADMTLICEQPKINPHVLAMRERLAGVMQVAIEQLSIKATTTEQLGFTGRGEGIAAQAVVLLNKI